ncbi:MAG: hypothetical protein RL541_223 [Pseudomonadota bacterium]|jgi:hypothetical protein
MTVTRINFLLNAGIVAEQDERNKKKKSQFNDVQAKKMTRRVILVYFEICSSGSPVCKTHGQNDVQMTG